MFQICTWNIRICSICTLARGRVTASMKKGFVTDMKFEHGFWVNLLNAGLILQSRIAHATWLARVIGNIDLTKRFPGTIDEVTCANWQSRAKSSAKVKCRNHSNIAFVNLFLSRLIWDGSRQSENKQVDARSNSSSSQKYTHKDDEITDRRRVRNLRKWFVNPLLTVHDMLVHRWWY